MFPEQLKKILDLIKTTGDRVVVYNPSTPDDSYVILDFDRYAKMINGSKTEKENIKNKESLKLISEAVNIGEKKLDENVEIDKDLKPNSLKTENLTEDDLTDKINREISMWKNRDDSAFLGEENKPKKAWQIPPQVKNNAQNIE